MTSRARVARAVFPPEQVAEVKAIACELPAVHGLPLSRFTRGELHRLVVERGVCDASASTIWRWLRDDALRPWQQRSWLFLRDPDLLVARLRCRGANLAPRDLHEAMRLIIHRARVAALAAERVYFASHIEVLEPDHPERRFVAALCLYSHAVDARRLDRPFRQDDAECFARLLLMPEEALDPVAGWPDAELAELFTVPLDQVAARRRDRTARRSNG